MVCVDLSVSVCCWFDGVCACRFACLVTHIHVLMIADVCECMSIVFVHVCLSVCLYQPVSESVCLFYMASFLTS
jgi:hypothetical protein